MSPTPQELSVATDALRTESVTWTGQSDEMSAVKTKIEGLEFSRIEGGLFQAIVGPHTNIVQKMAGLTGQAAQRFDEVASVLNLCATTYEEEDRAGKHRIDNLW
ncbi:hypothetical protein ACFWUP_27435 [Nocardia sp. NPDC058658]|uniref:hypothetical protein n=1 Tax=Nocardia sp. NPDC058658 TaxID=3346580 RepID=UPI003650ACD8